MKSLIRWARTLNHIQPHLLFFFLLIFVLVNLTFFLFYLNTERANERYVRLLDRFVTLSEIADLSKAMVDDLQAYLIGTRDDYRMRYEAERARLEMLAASVADWHSTPPYPIEWKNYASLLRSFRNAADATVRAFENDDVERYSSSFHETKKIGAFIGEQTLALIDQELNRYRTIYEKQSEQKAWLWRMGWAMHASLLVLIALIAYLFSETLARPLRALATAASTLAEGRFDVPDLAPSGVEETRILTRSFNKMKERLRKTFTAMEESAAKDRLLKEMQLKHLQRQINPHFLFNTLNMLSKSALLEGAERTSDLIAAVADLLRYDFDRHGEAVPISDELRHVQNYAEILEARFGKEKVRFTFEIDEALTSLFIPKLTLQPLVENAYFHGIEGQGRPGEIAIRLYRDGDIAVLEVRDNGRGMDMGESAIDPPEKRTRGGMGLSNVHQRIALFYEGQASLDMHSEMDRGTTVAIRLPLQISSETSSSEVKSELRYGRADPSEKGVN